MTRRTKAIATTHPPRETAELRRELEKFLNQPLSDFLEAVPRSKNGKSITVGAVKWGVYAFFDYDGEPIYVGQTRESLGTRIRRHLTNQRTDAVAMAVLDPFEVKTIKVWPLTDFQEAKGKPSQNVFAAEAAKMLNSLERTIFESARAQSRFNRILNEKDPPIVPLCHQFEPIVGDIVNAEVASDREHPDVRIARRAQTISRLAQTIAARSVKVGLRRALFAQSTRLQALAEDRFNAVGGDNAVEIRSENEPTEEDVGLTED